MGVGLVCCSLYLTPARADIRLSIESIEASQVKIHQLSAVWLLSQPQPRLDLQVGRLQVPAQGLDLTAVQLSCRPRQAAPHSLVCEDGSLKLPLPQLDRPTIPFSLQLQFSEQSDYRLDAPDIRVIGGRVALSAQSDGTRHRLAARGHGLSMPGLWRWADPGLRKAFRLQRGRAEFQLQSQLVAGAAVKWEANAQLSGLAGESPDGLKVIDGLGFKLRAARTQAKDRFQISGSANQGEGYVEPVFLSFSEYPVELSTTLDLRRWDRPVLHDFELRQQGVGRISGDVQLSTGKTLRATDLQLRSIAADLAPLGKLYLLPFVYGTAMESLQLSGQLSGGLHWREGPWRDTRGHLQLSRVDVQDSENRIELRGLELDAYLNHDRPSLMSWQSGRLLALELGRLDSRLLLQGDQLELLEPLNLPVFDGELQIDRLLVSRLRSAQRQLEFEAYLTPISLALLTEALGWTPMQGKISGVLPSMTYQSGRLELGGNLLIRVFDGQVLVQKMVVQDLFGSYPILHADMRINNLNLGAITTQFDFGSIEGRLSGHVNELVLENWQPVAFDAWLGTPEGDRSRRRISQRAIENISDLGGVGVAGVLSRGFMRFFDTFSYKRIAVGCVLSNGICEVNGVIPAATGYYLVEGGGLPRIDIIGHNRKILWRVFLKRLERVLATE